MRLLEEAAPERLEAAARDASLLERAAALDARLAEHRNAPPSREGAPVAYFCAEYAIHASLPIYSGGLGALAGDLVKEASDRCLPFVAVGLLYRQGYFRQRIDLSGWQREYWLDTDVERLPAALVTGDDGAAGDGHRAGPRRGDRRADLARGRRPRAAAAARRRAARELGDRALHLLAALRRPARDPPQPVRPARDRRPPRAEGAGRRARGDPPQRGPRRVRRAGGAGRDGRGGRRQRAAAHGLHDAHAGPGRQRRLPRRRDRAAAGADPGGPRLQGQRGAGARPHASRRRARAVRDHAAGHPDRARHQRRRPAPRRGRARDVAGAVARPRAGRRPDHARHQRRARADVDRRADAVAAGPAPRRGLDHARRGPGDVGGHRRASPTTS